MFRYGKELTFAEPHWYQWFESPYYTDSHRQFRAKIRKFIEKEIHPYVNDWEEKHVSTGAEMPLDFVKKAAELGIYGPMWPEKYGGTPPEGGFDPFHDLIWNDELARAASAGVTSCFTIVTMALPPVLLSKNQYIIDKVARDVIAGRKFISLCISEPSAGSDVANMRTTAKRDGDHYIINGQKKWITFGIFADFFTVAARTGDQGAKGISLFLLERNMPGLKVTRMKLQGAWLSGTALVAFDDVRVPATHMLGPENEGFKMIMHNFNHERFSIAVTSNRGSRHMLSESIQYALQRRTFGKRLMEHQTIRMKIADMAMRVEAAHAMLENVAYQMQQGIEPVKLGGYMALVKVFATRTLELCVREAAQIFGGASYVRGGIGVYVERAARDVRGSTVPGGSDEIMADLAVRMAVGLIVKHRTQKALTGAKSNL